MENTLNLRPIERAEKPKLHERKSKKYSLLSNWTKAYFALINNTMAMK